MKSNLKNKFTACILMGTLGAFMSGCQSYTNSVCNTKNSVNVASLAGKYLATSKGDKVKDFVQITQTGLGEYVVVSTDHKDTFIGKSYQLVSCQMGDQLVFEQRAFSVDENGAPEGAFNLVTIQAVNSPDVLRVNALVMEEAKLKALNIPFERGKGLNSLMITVNNAGTPAEKLLQTMVSTDLEYQLNRVK